MNFYSFCYTFSQNLISLLALIWLKCDQSIQPSSYFSFILCNADKWGRGLTSVCVSPMTVENWDKPRCMCCSATDFPTGWVVLEEQSGGTGAVLAAFRARRCPVLLPCTFFPTVMLFLEAFPEKQRSAFLFTTTKCLFAFCSCSITESFSDVSV